MTDLLYLIFGILLMSCISIYNISKRKHELKILKQNITMQWGKVPKDQYRDGELKAVSSYFINLVNAKKGIHFIDDITWNDLDMDNVFKLINNTQSTVGEEYLYSILRKPVFEESILNERQRLIEYFMVNPVEREKLQIILAGIGKKRFTVISDYFFNNEVTITINNILFILLSLGFLLSPVVMIFNIYFGIICMVIMYITNITVYYIVKNRMDSHLEKLSYVVNLIKCSKKISDIGISAIDIYTGKLKESACKINSISINSFYQLFYQTNAMFLEDIKVVFLGELIAFGSLLKNIKKYNNEISTLYEIIGLLDSMISIASYRESLNFYSSPKMYKSDIEKLPTLFFSDAYHPLLKDPVTNSINLLKPALITGSNASGKSTFLKTVAINAIFAQTINTCLAREYKSCYFKIFTSMALQDDLAENESYYISEIKSLKRIFSSLNDDFPLLCMIDEVLRGTNTIERIAASSEVLRSLGESNCMCIAATHDIELTSMLDYQYDNYNFLEKFEDDKILFDYKIYPGKSTTRNAINLLRIIGFGCSIVEAADAKAKRFLQEGRW